MSIAWYWPDWSPADACSDPPSESCADAACPLHGETDDEWWAADEREDDE